ncbi:MULTISPECIES: DMT family transporter [Lysinibacillus]|uniref:DMT family transporter n=2 Tax=Lysinibacillus capsici TaxID=2115968 RepID=A0ABY8KS96_9BACI|nr:DMT family transporter [Lysinibacillus capsici]MCT1538667.1 DMT family transporter [Lysinibacillus capsici]MCT1569375.1 DMT family transporter [Lysinibacillus capsici]MCT1646390.1 DMT family transporter [Lysinibacillus capsici]MCT1725104.1 DMT family transporter [Lysinibacillus capsici]MCT1784716.1 DMT family transporter [Lysinibacillus capsici]
MGLMLVTSLLWGGNFVVAKTLVAHASPMTLTLVRWLIAVIVLLPLVWWKEKRLVPAKAALVPLFLMGITGVALFNIFQFLALERTTSTNAGLISTMNTMSIALFSFAFLKEKINGWQLLAMVLSLIGVFLVLSKGDWQLLWHFQLNTGDLWMVAAVCVWGLYSVCSKWAMQTTSPLMATLYAGLFGVLILVPFTITDFTFSEIDSSFILSLLYTGVISTVVCMVFWNIGVQQLGATTSGIFLNFNPIFTALLAFLFIGEQLSWLQGIGGIIVILGCYLFTHFKTKTPQAVL